MKENSSKPRSVLYLITKANWGGAQRYVFELAQAAQQNGYEVEVAYGEPGALADRLREIRIPAERIGGLGRDVHMLGEVRAFLSMVKLLRTKHPDVVHLNSSKAGAMGGLAARLAGVSCIIFTAHGWAYNERRPAWQKIPIAFFHYFAVLMSHRTICNSEATRRDARWMPFVQGKCSVIRLGIPPPLFVTREEAREFLLPRHAAGTWIGSIAELHPNKRIGDAIRAIAKIVSDFPNIELIVMGEGDERPRLERLARELGVENRVHLLGHVADADRYLKALDIFVFPSYTESLGYALIEAGYAGLPAVATRVGGLPEIIDDHVSGLLVPREDPDALANALRSLLNDENKRRQFGEALRAKVSKQFSIDRMVRETLRAYRS